MRTEEVRPFYDLLAKKRGQLLVKRLVDICGSAVLLVLLSPVFAVLAIAIKVDSPGPVFYRQLRVTQYGKRFRIFKFRTMCDRADQIGSAVTVGNDARVTRVGKAIRRLRLDEISQLVDVFRGTMTFVGTRPEVPQYVDAYTPLMRATLLLPAGVTSMASITFKDEADILSFADNVDDAYIRSVLPRKMEFNLRDIESFSVSRDFSIMLKTVSAVFGETSCSGEADEQV
ncbi:sugar transferase [Adlercreutzia muris]